MDHDVPHLTVAQAAEQLNVSPEYVMGLVKAGQLGHCADGEVYWVWESSLQEYKEKDDAQRRAAADELTQLTQESGMR